MAEEAAADLHPMAPAHLPSFITPPGESDALFVTLAIGVVLALFGAGLAYFSLHALPERMAHRNADTAQFQIVGILALLALFTHNNLFWIGALLLAAVNIPDLTTPLKSIATSLEAREMRRARRRGAGAATGPAGDG